MISSKAEGQRIIPARGGLVWCLHDCSHISELACRAARCTAREVRLG